VVLTVAHFTEEEHAQDDIHDKHSGHDDKNWKKEEEEEEEEEEEQEEEEMKMVMVVVGGGDSKERHTHYMKKLQ
jgi:hypothetical protein